MDTKTPLLVKVVLISSLIFLHGCGSSDSDEKIPEPEATNPIVTINAESEVVNESHSITLTATATDHLNNTLSASLTCDKGQLDGEIYTAPSVAEQTMVTCNAEATDITGLTGTASVSLTINTVTPIITLIDEKTEATAAQLTSFNIQYADLESDSVNSMINGEPVVLGVSSENEVNYIPLLSGYGTQKLEVTLDGENVSYEFELKEPTAKFDDARQYVNSYLDDIKMELETLAQLQSDNGVSAASTQALFLFAQEFDSTNGRYASLTNDEVQLLAYIFQENLDGSFNKNISKAMSTIDQPQDLQSCKNAVGGFIVNGVIAYKLIVGGFGMTATGAGGAVGPILAIVGLIPAKVARQFLLDIKYECFYAAKSALQGFTDSQNKNNNIEVSPLAFDILDFEDGVDKEFKIFREAAIYDGADSYVDDAFSLLKQIIDKANSLFDFVGRENVPTYILTLFNPNLTLQDLTTEAVNPEFISVENVSPSSVSGGLKDLYTDDSFTLNFSIADSSVGQADFSFSILDNGVSPNTTTNIDGTVTRNPPVAFDASATVVTGASLEGYLQAEFESTFEITQTPSSGTVELLDSATGEFKYIAADNLMSEVNDLFKFKAKNSSPINNGESNEATFNIKIVPVPENTPPTARMVVNIPNVTLYYQDLEVNLDASTSTDNEGLIAEYKWRINNFPRNWEDIEAQTVPFLTQVFSSHQTVKIELRVYDEEGLFNTASEEITLTGAFTKLDEEGNALDNEAEEWACVRDNISGLVWEVKTGNPNSTIETDDIHYINHTYSWYDSTVSESEGKGQENRGSCFNDTNCDTEKFVNYVNAKGYCGSSSWRLPTTEELKTLYYKKHRPVLGGDYTSFRSRYWSSELGAYSQAAKTVDFYQDGNTVVQDFSKSSQISVRLVR